MANSKTKKPPKDPQDMEQLRSDVASLASSLGLSSSLPTSGFNDADFRRTGHLKSSKRKGRHNHTDEKSQLGNKPKKTQNLKDQKNDNGSKKSQHELKTDNAHKLNNQKGKPKPKILSLDNETNSFKTQQVEKFKHLPKLPLVKASALSPEWYNDEAELEEKVLGGEERNRKVVVKDVDEWKSVVEKKREFGERLAWQYAQDFNSSKGKSADMKMVIAAQKSGTEADKVTAFEIMVGENPIANMRSLDALLGMVASKVGKRYAFKGFKALAELFIKLLPDRKLKTLLQRPLNSLPETKDGHSLLLFWYWEEWLKQRYERFVVALEEAARDILPQLKDKASKTIYTLLTSKSEQERRLLSALVNKLGDPQNKNASNADFYLSNLLADHPKMKGVVIDEVDTFLFRPHLNLRAKYHAVNFLSQIRLSHQGDGPKLAKRLIDVYFALFKVLITETNGGQKNIKADKISKTKSSNSSKEIEQKETLGSHVELDSRLLSALLTGVNRAFPYVATHEVDDVIEAQTPMLFKLVHSKNFNVGVQALMLLDKISSKNQIVSDRFYRALYSKLLLSSAMNSSKVEMFIGLLLRAMKNDINLKRIAAFSKRLLQVALQQPPQLACGCLFLLSEVLKARPPLWNMVIQHESIDDDIEHFEDVRDEDDSKPNTTEKKENDATNFANEQGGVSVNSKEQEKEDEEEEQEEEENLPASDSDIKEYDSDDLQELLIGDISKHPPESKSVADTTGSKQILSPKSILPGGYDPCHREPSYCNADQASWWELMVLASHVHPSVATMAGTLLSGTNIVYDGNPLSDLALPAFLDKFMEKKPKQSTWHGGSQIEPVRKADMTNHIIGPEILSLAEVDVPPEDLVFHKFYMNKMHSSKKPKKKKKKLPEEEAAEELFDVDGGNVSEEDDVEGDDESDNEEVENMLDSVNPSVGEEDGDYDYDDLDEVADEDDDDLIGDAGDAEMDVLSGMGEGEDNDAENDGGYGDSDVGEDGDDDDINIGDIDDDEDDDDEIVEEKPKKGKRKKMGASPFASLEDYKHLMEEEPEDNISKREKGWKPRKRKKRSSK